MNILDLQDAQLRARVRASARVQRALTRFFQPLVHAREGEAVTDILSDPALAGYYQERHGQAVADVRKRYGTGPIR